MVKQLIISPDEVRQKETIALGTIPVNQYSRSLADELAAGTLTKDDAVRIYRDMCLIREFETMLDEIKRLGKYRDVAYVHQGPAHLSIGQEAAAVGEAFLLGVEDHIFGSHRSHGEILAKGLSAIRQMDDEFANCSKICRSVRDRTSTSRTGLSVRTAWSGCSRPCQSRNAWR